MRVKDHMNTVNIYFFLWCTYIFKHIFQNEKKKSKEIKKKTQGLQI